MSLAGTEHSLVVVQPLGQGQPFQLRSCDTSDGSCTVRAHDHDLAGTIDDLQHGFLRDRVAGLDEQVVEFHLWRDDLGIATAAEQLYQSRLHLAAFQTLGKQSIPRSFRSIDVDVHWDSLQIL